MSSDAGGSSFGRGGAMDGGSDELGGGRSSGVDRIDDMARGRTRVLHLRNLRELMNPTEARTGPFGHRSLVSDELVRRRHTGLAVIGVAARNRPRGEGEMTAGLTGSWMGGSFGSGKRRSERAAKGISGGPRLKKRSGEPLQGASARVAWRRWRRGRRRGFLARRGGMRRLVAVVVLVGAPRGARWLRARTLGGERGTRERGAGRRVASRGASRRRGGGQAGRCRGARSARAHRAHASPTGARWRMVRWPVGWASTVGPAQCQAAGGPGKHFSILFSFLFSDICF